MSANDLFMAERPGVDGWKGGSEDFGFVRTLDGHIGINLETDPELASDMNFRRNERRGFADADLSGEYD